MLFSLRQSCIKMRMETAWGLDSNPLHGSPGMRSVQPGRMLILTLLRRAAAVQSALESVLGTVSEELLHWASESGDTSGCTAVTAVSLGNSFLVAHIGDSKAILCQQKSHEGTPHMSRLLLCHQRTCPPSMSQFTAELHAIPNGVTSRCRALRPSMRVLY